MQTAYCLSRGESLMSDKVRSYVFVGLQFLLIALVIVTPGPSIVTWPTAISVALSIVSYLALGVIAFSLLELGSARTALPIPTERAELVTRGLYKFSRHPIYAALIMGMAAIAVRDAKLGGMVAASLLVVVLYLKSSFEEKLLRARFSDYELYSRTTGRFFPKLSR
jgi:protein-S-isoprenylcysteine O-methyltransferase Ste14